MTKYRMFIDGIFYGTPKGLESMTLKIQFQDNVLQLFTEGTVTYFKNGHGQAYSVLKASYEADRCFESIWTLQYTSDGGVWINASSGKIKGKNLTFDHGIPSVQITLASESGIEKLGEGSSDKFSDDGNESMELFQYESGGWYQDDNSDKITRKVKKFTDHLIALGANAGVTMIPDGILNQDHQDCIFSLSVLSVGNGDIFVLTIESGIGSTFNLEITASAIDTLSTIGDKVRNGLLHTRGLGATGNSYEAQEEQHRIKSVSHDGSGAITIETDWPVDSMVFTQNGSPLIATKTQEYKYGLNGLYISQIGLDDEQKIESTWDGTFDMMKNLFDCVLLEDEADLTVSSYMEEFGTIPTTQIQNRKIKLKAKSELMVEKGRFSSAFKLENYYDSQSNWSWIGGESVQSFNQIIPPAPTLVTVATAGIGSLTGFLTYGNASSSVTETYTMTLLHDASGTMTAVGSRTITIFPNQTHPEITIESFFNDPNDNVVCFSVGDEIRLQYSNTSNLLITAGNIDLTQGSFCFDYPQATERSIERVIYNKFPDMANCSGSLNRRIGSDYYLGMGFAISQIISEATYDDTTFLILGETPASDLVAKRWKRETYYPDDSVLDTAGCPCLKDSIITKYYYNMILQLPWIIDMFRHRLPFDIDVDAYDFTTTVDALDVYVHTTSQKTTTLPRKVSQIDEVELETALKISEFVNIRNEKSVQVDVEGTPKNGIIKSITVAIDGRKSSQIILV